MVTELCEQRTLDDVAFTDALKELKTLFQNLREFWNQTAQKAADLLGKMSHDQLASAKTELRPYIRADALERLALFGRGRIPFYLADPTHGLLTASDLRRLSPKAREAIADGERKVEVLCMKGTEASVIVKSLRTLTPMEAEQVIDPDTGIVPPAKQRERMVSGLKSLAVTTPKGEYLEFDGAKLSDDAKTLYLFFRREEEPVNSQSVRCKAPLSSLKGFVK